MKASRAGGKRKRINNTKKGKINNKEMNKNTELRGGKCTRKHTKWTVRQVIRTDGV